MIASKVNTILLSLILVITAIMAGRYVTTSNDGENLSASKNVAVSTQNTDDLSNKLNEIAAELKDQKSYHARVNKMMQAQETIMKRLTRLDKQLKTLSLDGSDPEEAINYDERQRQEQPHLVAERDFGQWMDTSLTEDKYDETLTEQNLIQTQQLLTKIPGVNLQDMKCAPGFCRASFNSLDGSRPNLRSLYGQPPFTNEISTMFEEDGSVTMYFTDNEVSLQDLKTEIVLERGAEPLPTFRGEDSASVEEAL